MVKEPGIQDRIAKAVSVGVKQQCIVKDDTYGKLVYGRETLECTSGVEDQITYNRVQCIYKLLRLDWL